MKKEMVPQEELYNSGKVVLFPFCMTSCTDSNYKGFYRCDDGCSGCQIGELKPEIERLGYRVWIAGSDDSVFGLLKNFYEKDHKIKVLGVSCGLSKSKLEKQLGYRDLEGFFNSHHHYVIPKVCNDSGNGQSKKIDGKTRINESDFLSKLKQLNLVE